MSTPNQAPESPGSQLTPPRIPFIPRTLGFSYTDQPLIAQTALDLPGTQLFVVNPPISTSSSTYMIKMSPLPNEDQVPELPELDDNAVKHHVLRLLEENSFPWDEAEVATKAASDNGELDEDEKIQLKELRAALREWPDWLDYFNKPEQQGEMIYMGRELVNDMLLWLVILDLKGLFKQDVTDCLRMFGLPTLTLAHGFIKLELEIPSDDVTTSR